jgi:hypothetical protein
MRNKNVSQVNLKAFLSYLIAPITYGEKGDVPLIRELTLILRVEETFEKCVTV